METTWRMNTDLFSQKTQNNTEKERRHILTTETLGAQEKYEEEKAKSWKLVFKLVSLCLCGLAGRMPVGMIRFHYIDGKSAIVNQKIFNLNSKSPCSEAFLFIVHLLFNVDQCTAVLLLPSGLSPSVDEFHFNRTTFTKGFKLMFFCWCRSSSGNRPSFRPAFAQCNVVIFQFPFHRYNRKSELWHSDFL